MADRITAYVAAGLLLTVVSVCAPGAAAQLTSGTVSAVSLYDPGNGQPPGTCPGAFWSPNPPATQAVCYGAKMSCSNQATTPTLGFIYSYVTPPSVKGTVVLFPGGQGEQPDTARLNRFAQYYYGANYEGNPGTDGTFTMFTRPHVTRPQIVGSPTFQQSPCDI